MLLQQFPALGFELSARRLRLRAAVPTWKLRDPALMLAVWVRVTRWAQWSNTSACNRAPRAPVTTAPSAFCHRHSRKLPTGRIRASCATVYSFMHTINKLNALVLINDHYMNSTYKRTARVFTVLYNNVFVLVHHSFI